MDPTWYLRRLRKMGAAEVIERARHSAIKKSWARRQVAPGALDPLSVNTLVRRPSPPLVGPAGESAEGNWWGGASTDALIASADELMAGRMTLFGYERTDLIDPDWHHDPSTGGRADPVMYSFAVPYRDEAKVGNVKQLWELSRHHHLTVLAAAYNVTGDERYAQRVDAHLKSWLATNPFLSGVHWTSGIELGIRLVSWVWTRRLLDGWSGAPALFEENDDFARSVHHHCEWLEAFLSGGTSANNHVVAEAAGLLSASCAFAWSSQSTHWRNLAAARLTHELHAQTFTSGLNRELASEYHGLTLELGLVGVMEAERAGHAMPIAAWRDLCSMVDAIATVIDAHGEMPRQGDADDGLVLVVDGWHGHRWHSLLRTGAELFGALTWWPKLEGTDVRTELLARWTPSTHVFEGRPSVRHATLSDAGMSILRSPQGHSPEVWCRADAGPLGFLSIAAHGHADALAIELRLDGVELLADPGTYCYHGEPQWRRYFRGTISHNTIEVIDADQSVSGGPFLWMEHASSLVRSIETDGDTGEITSWTGEHHGYAKRCGLVHRRTVQRFDDSLTVIDVLDGASGLPIKMAWHFGPAIDVSLLGSTVTATWTTNGEQHRATLALAPELTWSAHRGETEPVLGWYSAGFGRKEPSWTLIGTGSSINEPLTTSINWS
jgi:Heparinase II/III-like protein/Heparinase II/III N-terminus